MLIGSRRLADSSKTRYPSSRNKLNYGRFTKVRWGSSSRGPAATCTDPLQISPPVSLCSVVVLFDGLEGTIEDLVSQDSLLTICHTHSKSHKTGRHYKLLKYLKHRVQAWVSFRSCSSHRKHSNNHNGKRNNSSRQQKVIWHARNDLFFFLRHCLLPSWLRKFFLALLCMLNLLQY